MKQYAIIIKSVYQHYSSTNLAAVCADHAVAAKALARTARPVECRDRSGVFRVHSDIVSMVDTACK